MTVILKHTSIFESNPYETFLINLFVSDKLSIRFHHEQNMTNQEIYTRDNRDERN